MMMALYTQPKTVAPNIPTESREISRYTAFFAFLGRISRMGIMQNIKGLTFAVGKVFWKFQS